MGKEMNCVAGRVIGRIAYVWLITSETIEEICCLTVGRLLRDLFSGQDREGLGTFKPTARTRTYGQFGQ